MAQLVANAPNIPPWLFRAEAFTLTPKPDNRLADDLQFAFDGGNGHRIRTERFEIHPGRELPDHRNCVDDVAE